MVCAIAGEGAVADRHRPIVEDAAAATVGGIAGEGAVADRQRTLVEDAAAALSCAIAGEGAVADRQRAIVGDAAAEAGEVGGIAGEGAVVQRQRATVIDAAAGVGGVGGEGAVVQRQRTLVEDAAAGVGNRATGQRDLVEGKVAVVSHVQQTEPRCIGSRAARNGIPRALEGNHAVDEGQTSVAPEVAVDGGQCHIA